jgi:hypothetical protein
MTTLAEQWKAEGEARGKAEGKAETVIETLETRFGPLDRGQREKVKQMSSGDLSRLIRRAVTSPTLDGVFADDTER